jgi:hypothetical protein
MGAHYVKTISYILMAMYCTPAPAIDISRYVKKYVEALYYYQQTSVFEIY